MPRIYRLHGKPPYVSAVLHGGPGAAGSCAGLASALAFHIGVVEPLQSKESVDGQVNELYEDLQAFGPMAVIGHSWGAWLALLYAAAHPGRVTKLFLAGCPVLEERYTTEMQNRRMARLSHKDLKEALHMMQSLEGMDGEAHPGTLAKFGSLMEKADSFSLLEHGGNLDEAVDQHIYQSVWGEAQEMRRSGRLLELCKAVTCPIVLLHGEDDPSPWQGVYDPLVSVGREPRLHLFPCCGHTPWKERFARDEFLNMLTADLNV